MARKRGKRSPSRRSERWDDPKKKPPPPAHPLAQCPICCHLVPTHLLGLPHTRGAGLCPGRR